MKPLFFLLVMLASFTSQAADSTPADTGTTAQAADSASASTGTAGNKTDSDSKSTDDKKPQQEGEDDEEPDCE